MNVSPYLRNVRIKLSEEAAASQFRPTSILANAAGVIETMDLENACHHVNSDNITEIVSVWKTSRSRIMDGINKMPTTAAPAWIEFDMRGRTLGVLIATWNAVGLKGPLYLARRFYEDEDDCAPYCMSWSSSENATSDITKLVNIHYVQTGPNPVSPQVHPGLKKRAHSVAALVFGALVRLHGLDNIGSEDRGAPAPVFQFPAMSGPATPPMSPAVSGLAA